MTQRHKEIIKDLAKRLYALGFTLMATEGTAASIEEVGIPVQRVKKIAEGHPNLIDHLIDGEVTLAMNTPNGKAHAPMKAKFERPPFSMEFPVLRLFRQPKQLSKQWKHCGKKR